MAASGLGRQMSIRVWLAREGSCPRGACQLKPLELLTTGPEKSHIGYSLEPDSTRVPRQCLLNRCSWQKAVTSTKSEREILNLKCFLSGGSLRSSIVSWTWIYPGRCGLSLRGDSGGQESLCRSVCFPFASSPPCEGPKGQ